MRIMFIPLIPAPTVTILRWRGVPNGCSFTLYGGFTEASGWLEEWLRWSASLFNLCKAMMKLSQKGVVSRIVRERKLGIRKGDLELRHGVLK